MNTLKINRRIALSVLALIAVAAFMLSLAFTALAQTNDPGIPDFANTASQSVTPFIVSFAASHAWLATILFVIAVLRVVMKPIMTVVESIIHASAPADDAKLAAFEQGTIYRWVLWVIDWLGSIKTPTNIAAGTTSPLGKAP